MEERVRCYCVDCSLSMRRVGGGGARLPIAVGSVLLPPDCLEALTKMEIEYPMVLTMGALLSGQSSTVWRGL